MARTQTVDCEGRFVAFASGGLRFFVSGGLRACRR
jgi:hypothetical protein